MIKTIENKYKLKAEFLLLISAIIWGASFPTVKVAMDYVSPHFYLFLRFIITLILFVIIFFKQIRNIAKKEIYYGFILGIFLYLGFIFQTVGIKYTTASNSAFITGFSLALLPFAQYFMIKKTPKIEHIIGIIISIIGLFFLTGYGISKIINLGDFITILCAVAFTLQIVLLDIFSNKSGYIAIIFGQFIVMTVLSLLSTVIIEVIAFNNLKLEINAISLFSILFNAIFSALIALYISNRFQKFTTPVKAGIIYNMEQVFAVVFSYFLIKEVLSFNQIIGAIFMLTGLLISEFFRNFLFFIKKCLKRN